MADLDENPPFLCHLILPFINLHIYLNLNGIVLRFIYIDLNMKKNVKSYYLRLPKHIQYSAGRPSQNNAFAVFNAEESLHLQLGATWRWKKNIFNWSWGRRSLLKDCTVKENLWSWLFLCALFSGCGFYASFWREIRIWCKIFFKPFAWINSERRRGMVLSFVIWSGAKSASSDPPLVQSYYVSGGKQTAMLGRVTLLYQELSFNFYSVPVPVA